MKIVVAGGGYAGLACLMELRRRMRDAELVLLDPGEHHLKITHLHETIRRPLERFRVPFAQLARRIGFSHHQVSIDAGQAERCRDRSAVQADSAEVEFDYLVIATGARPPRLPRGEHAYDRDDLTRDDAGRQVQAFLDDAARPRHATVVGGGPTGLQFAFELADLLRQRRDAPVQLRLVDRDPALLGAYPAGLGDYVTARLDHAGIEYLPCCEYVDSRAGEIELRQTSDAVSYRVPSGLTLLFPGATPSPGAVDVDRFGRLAGTDNVFSAGDCARYNSRGDDAMTAQVAVRQGKLVASNIDRLSRGARPLEYFFRELGYVISLGPLDAVGWMLLKDQVVSGLPAFAIKEIIEAQYDLFVAGLDTYIV